MKGESVKIGRSCSWIQEESGILKLSYEKIEFMEILKWEKYVIGRLAEKRGDYFFEKKHEKKKHCKNVWNKKDYICKIFGEKHWWYGKNDYRGLKSIIFLTTTWRTIASRPKDTIQSIKYQQNQWEKALNLYKRWKRSCTNRTDEPKVNFG